MSDEGAFGPPGAAPDPGPPPGAPPLASDGGMAGPQDGETPPGDVGPEATPPEAAPSPPPAPAPADAGGPPGDVALEESFLTIWLHPRATIRRIVTADPGYRVIPLAAIGGIAQVLASASRSDTPGMTLAGALLGAFVGGPLWGLFGLYLGAWLMRLTGRWWLHGQARPEELRAALGWAALPHVVSLPLWLLATAAFGQALFTQTRSELAAASPVYLLFALAVLTLQVWGLVIASAGVAEVQGYRSAWKGFANLLLALLLVIAAAVIVALVLVFLVALASGLAR